MEVKKMHVRGFSESDKQLLQHLPSNLATRQKLLEKGLNRDKPLKPFENSLKNQRFERKSAPSAQVPRKTESRARIMKDFSSKSPVPKPAHKRASSTDQKQEVLNPSRKRVEKPTDCILRVAEQLSIKKLNQLYQIRTIGDAFVCRALLALLAEVDYHIGHCLEFTVEMFFEYISTPGIVVQTVKRIPEMIFNDRIPIESFEKSLELFNQAEEISTFPGIEILATLLKTIFEFKGFEVVQLKTLPLPDKASNVKFQILKPSEVQSTSLTKHRPTLSEEPSKKCSQVEPIIKITKIEEKLEPFKKPEHHRVRSQTCRPGEEFMHSKSMLLEKFYKKMGISEAEIIEREKSPAKVFLNCSIENFQTNDNRSYIKSKGRPSSLTPTSSHSRTLTENKNFRQEKIEDLKKTQFLLGSRFYKKIDQKFVDTLLDKMKKESFDLKRLRKNSFEEYSKKKNLMIAANKEKWVVDTVRYLETSELLVPSNENDLGQDVKHDAVLAHLSNEQHVGALVRRAEQLELSYRRGTNK